MISITPEPTSQPTFYWTLIWAKHRLIRLSHQCHRSPVATAATDIPRTRRHGTHPSAGAKGEPTSTGMELSTGSLGHDGLRTFCWNIWTSYHHLTYFFSDPQLWRYNLMSNISEGNVFVCIDRSFSDQSQAVSLHSPTLRLDLGFGSATASATARTELSW